METLFTVSLWREGRRRQEGGEKGVREGREEGRRERGERISGKDGKEGLKYM